MASVVSRYTEFLHSHATIAACNTEFPHSHALSFSPTVMLPIAACNGLILKETRCCVGLPREDADKMTFNYFNSNELFGTIA